MASLPRLQIPGFLPRPHCFLQLLQKLQFITQAYWVYFPFLLQPVGPWLLSKAIAILCSHRHYKDHNQSAVSIIFCSLADHIHSVAAKNLSKKSQTIICPPAVGSGLLTNCVVYSARSLLLKALVQVSQGLVLLKQIKVSNGEFSQVYLPASSPRCPQQSYQYQGRDARPRL